MSSQKPYQNTKQIEQTGVKLLFERNNDIDESSMEMEMDNYEKIQIERKDEFFSEPEEIDYFQSIQ